MFFSELRVITIKREKYSTLKTTTNAYQLEPTTADVQEGKNSKPRPLFQSAGE
jgi:hypothetical protein